MKKFSDFSKESVLDGDKIKIDDIVNEEIELLAFNIKESKYKEKNYLTIQIKRNDKKYVAFTGSEVLIDQVKKYESELPFKTTIRKINKYYSLT